MTVLRLSGLGLSPVQACVRVPELREILLLGFYPAQQMAAFVTEMTALYKVNIRYLQEFCPLGTAGGLHHFRDQVAETCISSRVVQ